MKSWFVLLVLGVAQAQGEAPGADLDLTGWPPEEASFRLVRLEELTQLFAKADRLVVRDWAEPAHERTRLLYESNARADLDALKSALKLKAPESWTHCLCRGSVEVAFFAGETELGSFSNQHSISIRCSLWDSDVELADPEPLLKWFDERKVYGPREEVEEMRREQERSEVAEKRWLAAMPTPLLPLWTDDVVEGFDQPDLASFREALAQIGDRNERVLALLRWYGSGDGPWSGFPAYECVAERLLLDYPTAVLNDIGCSIEFDAAQLEGLARLLAGWDFSMQRPDDLDSVSPRLKARLLLHVLVNDDRDRCSRARSAFGGALDFDPYAGAYPIAVLVQTDPWAMVLGADNPRVAVYGDGRVIRAKPTAERMTYRTFMLDEAGLEKVQATLQPVFDLPFSRSRYDLAPGITDQPESRIYAGDRDFGGTVSIYGLAVGEAPPVAANDPPAYPPQELLDLHALLSKLDSEQSEGWSPDFVEVMLWDDADAPEPSIHWPEDWPSLASNRAAKRGDSWSIFLDGSELPRLRELLAKRAERGALEIAGRKMAVTFRYTFPGTPSWRPLD